MGVEGLADLPFAQAGAERGDGQRSSDLFFVEIAGVDDLEQVGGRMEQGRVAVSFAGVFYSADFPNERRLGSS